MTSAAPQDVILFYGTKGPYGFFSQFQSCEFVEDGVRFCCAEQYMMYKKSLLFGDKITAAKILVATQPMEIKKLGRSVSNFDEATWALHREEIVVNGNWLKFSNSPLFRTALLGTGNSILAEASPNDRVWGIGLGISDPIAKIPSRWSGLNLLGKALMTVRERLRGLEA